MLAIAMLAAYAITLPWFICWALDEVKKSKTITGRKDL